MGNMTIQSINSHNIDSRCCSYYTDGVVAMGNMTLQSINSHNIDSRCCSYYTDGVVAMGNMTLQSINSLISRCQGYSRVIKVIQFLPVYIFIITR